MLHHSELLAELVRDGRLSPAAGDTTITYHDSCYLARHNDVLEAPRELVSRETGAETLAVACPFCTVMLDDGVRQTGRDLRVADVSTLLVEAIERGATDSESG